ncbi:MULTISPECIES: FG-GAP-like repeat-containing protein [Kitasatospora]|uniref:FG-GAP-like repeat-containing protein n=1 Tax=Kitasatospora cathayae TaxID=3004092 RepID=A0ABY7Q5J5_9ACTN|nr:FG-GAP-like repeat-containing protein [Kitasatospora sp. HUAS 3-15]WBP87934.1 FG-GAP-like repeat-containing protein [Kitasatospora sp. HUAS 3-15]
MLSIKSRLLKKSTIGTLVAASAIAGLTALPAQAATVGQNIASEAASQIGANACTGGGYYGSCTGDGGSPELWCADFAKWVWNQEGVDVSGLTAGAGSFYTYGKNNGTLSSTPAVGDAVVFNYSGGGYADHVAIVTQVNADGTIVTVGGDENGVHGNWAATSAVHQDGPYNGGLGWTPYMGMSISGYIAPVGGTAGGTTNPTPATPTMRLTAGDFNNDGKQDTLAVDNSTGHLFYYAGLGTGHFAAPVDLGGGWDNMRLHAADFNNDGKLDILAQDPHGELYFYAGLGTGHFAARVDLGSGWGNLNLTVGDFNGDGKADVLAVDTSGGHLYFYPGLGNGAFGTRTDLGSGWANMTLTAADFNGNGKLDLFAQDSSTGHAYYYPGVGDGSFGTRTDLGGGWGNYNVTVGDFSGDGKRDLMAIDTSGGHLFYYAGLGTGHFAAPVDLGSGWGTMTLTAADFNGDGKLDVQAQNASTGHMFFYPGLGDGSFGTRTDLGGGW